MALLGAEESIEEQKKALAAGTSTATSTNNTTDAEVLQPLVHTMQALQLNDPTPKLGEGEQNFSLDSLSSSTLISSSSAPSSNLDSLSASTLIQSSSRPSNNVDSFISSTLFTTQSFSTNEQDTFDFGEFTTTSKPFLSHYTTFQSEQIHRTKNLPEEPNRYHQIEAQKTILDNKYPDSPEKKEEILAKIAKNQIRNMTSYEILNEKFAEKAEVVQLVLQILKIKLGQDPITPTAVEAHLNAWHTEILNNQKIDAGIITDTEKTANYPNIQSPHLLAILLHAKDAKRGALQAITDEIQYLLTDNEAEIKKQVMLANESWQQIEANWLTEVNDRNPTLANNIKTWLTRIPPMLNEDQTWERDNIRNFVPEQHETKEERKKARSLVNGYEPITNLNRDKAKACLKAGELKPLRRTHEELSESMRTEMQFELGIRKISRSRQGRVTAIYSLVTGYEQWQQEFVTGADGRKTSHSPFPVRKAEAQSLLFNFVGTRNRAQQLMNNEGPQATEADKLSVAMKEKVLKYRI